MSGSIFFVDKPLRACNFTGFKRYFKSIPWLAVPTFPLPLALVITLLIATIEKKHFRGHFRTPPPPEVAPEQTPDLELEQKISKHI